MITKSAPFDGDLTDYYKWLHRSAKAERKEQQLKQHQKTMLNSAAAKKDQNAVKQNFAS